MDVTGKYRMTPSGRNINLHPLLFVRVSSILGRKALSYGRTKGSFILLEPVLDFAASITSRASDMFLQNNYNVFSKMIISP